MRICKLICMFRCKKVNDYRALLCFVAYFEDCRVAIVEEEGLSMRLNILMKNTFPDTCCISLLSL